MNTITPKIYTSLVISRPRNSTLNTKSKNRCSLQKNIIVYFTYNQVPLPILPFSSVLHVAWWTDFTASTNLFVQIQAKMFYVHVPNVGFSI